MRRGQRRQIVRFRESIFSPVMAKLDMDKLAKEVAAVATVGFGRPLRKGTKTQQLLDLAECFSVGEGLRSFRHYEVALRPSVERLGDGAIGQLARIEFRLAPEARKLHYFKERQAEATRQLGARGEALKRLEEAMCLAIAEDMVVRLNALAHRDPPPAQELHPTFDSVEELRRAKPQEYR